MEESTIYFSFMFKRSFKNREGVGGKFFRADTLLHDIYKPYLDLCFSVNMDIGYPKLARSFATDIHRLLLLYKNNAEIYALL